MFSEQRWRIHLQDIEAQISIGVHDHELLPQRILVSAAVECSYSHAPLTIDECFNYEPVYQFVTQAWPKRAHIALLETCVSELLTYIFLLDTRVAQAKVNIRKPDIFPGVVSVGVEAQWTRADFERHHAGMLPGT